MTVTLTVKGEVEFTCNGAKEVANLHDMMDNESQKCLIEAIENSQNINLTNSNDDAELTEFLE